MMTLPAFDYPEGATPLDPDAIAGLIPGLTTQGELNEFEAQNIAAALSWARRSRTLRRDLPTMGSLALLHRRMFNLTWRWAGRFRKTDTNIGISWYLVPTQVQELCGDIHFQAENAVYSWDELATRFHHRLVSIHPFPNGNGRHSRLAADLLLHFNNQPQFTWGAASLVENSATRKEYLTALREADAGDIVRLLRFVHS